MNSATICKQTILTVTAFLSIALFPTRADDPVTSAIDSLRMRRGQAIARENEATLQWLEGVLGQARLHKNTLEAERLEILVEQLKAETARLKADGDKRALLPTNQRELRAFLVGTLWAFDGTRKNALEFMPDGSLKSQKESFQYVVIAGRRVTIVWSPSTRVDCDLNEDGTLLTESDGAHGVLKRVR